MRIWLRGGIMGVILALLWFFMAFLPGLGTLPLWTLGLIEKSISSIVGEGGFGIVAVGIIVIFPIIGFIFGGIVGLIIESTKFGRKESLIKTQ